MNNDVLGKMISALRKKSGFTQAALAKALNVSDKTISKWETGCGFPEITQLPRLANLFNVTIDYLMTGETRGIVVAGNILTDIVKDIDVFPEKSTLVNITNIQQAVGGCVPNTLINIAKIDKSLFLSAIGKVGDDEYGRYVVGQMSKHGIDISDVKISENSPTSFTDVMNDTSTGERTFFHLKGANSEFGIDDVNVDSLNCKIFHLGYILLLDLLDKCDDEYGTVLARLLSKVQKKGIKTSIDVVTESGMAFKEKVVPALKYCNYAIMNELEACGVTGLSPRRSDGRLDIENIKTTMLKLMDCGVKDKVIVHAPEVGICLSSDKTFTIVPSLKLPKGYIKGSVGAGDAFAAASLYGLYKGFDDKFLLEFSSCAAACNLAGADSVSTMKSYDEIINMNKQYERRSIEEI